MSEGQPTPHDDQPAPSGATAGEPAYGAPEPPPYGAPEQPPSAQPYGQGQPYAQGQGYGQGQAQQPYAQQPYPQQPYAQPYGQPYGQPAVPTNTMAIISLVSSVLGLTFVPILGSIAGVITGHIARRQIAETGEQGSGAATAGLIIGYVGVALLVLGIIAFIAFFALAAGVATTSP